MKSININITISDINEWDVNWDNDVEVSQEISKLKLDLRYAISKELGIAYSSLKVDAEVTNN